MENKNKTKMENNMEKRTLTKVVEDYKNSTNTDIKNDFIKCCSYLNKHQEEVTREEYLELVGMVYHHYLQQVTKTKLPFQTYIPSDWKIVKPFKEELAILEENNGNPTSIDYSSIIGKYDPYTEVNMMYLIERYKYRYTKKNDIMNKYLNVESPNTNSNTIPMVFSSKLEYYIDKLNGSGNMDELLEFYDSTIKEVIQIVTDEMESSDIKNSTKQQTKYQVLYQYKDVFNKKLYQFETGTTFKNKFYTTTIPTMECVINMLRYLDSNDIDATIALIDDIFDVLNYRLKTHRITPKVYVECNNLVMQFQIAIVEMGLSPTDAVKYVTDGQWRKEFDTSNNHCE